MKARMKIYSVRLFPSIIRAESGQQQGQRRWAAVGLGCGVGAGRRSAGAGQAGRRRQRRVRWTFRIIQKDGISNAVTGIIFYALKKE